MPNYREMTAAELQTEAQSLQKEYEGFKARGLKLDLSRGKPGKDQLALSMKMLDTLNSGSDLTAENGMDCGNYGGQEGIPEARRLMAGLLEVEPDEVMMGGPASLNLMHDCITIAYLHGMPNSPTPWCKLPVVKFLCPSPGYDRHFAITQHLGFELIPVPMTKDGPDMDVVEQLVAADAAVKGIWCVPKYANPTGTTYSDETVRRLAALSPAAPDFVIMWDNAYSVHDLYPDDPDNLLPLMAELRKTGRESMALQFCSTAKVTFPGGGISAVGSSKENIAFLLKHFSLQTISFDKLNQLRHARFFGDLNGIRAHMRKHADILRPKFELVLETLAEKLGDLDIATWEKPKGGYFVALDTLEGCAKRTIALCKEAGVVMTGAGATFPYGQDPQDCNIRIAPSFATLEEIGTAAELFCLCVKLATVEKLLQN